MTSRYKECILHISCRVVRREVQCLENVVIILDFRTFCHVISELAENIHNLLSGNRYRMSCSKRNRISRHGSIEWIRCSRTSRLCGRFQLFYLSCSFFLENVQFLTKLLLQLRSDSSELFEKLRNFTFLAEKTNSGFFYILFCLALKISDFCKNLFYFLFHTFRRFELQI